MPNLKLKGIETTDSTLDLIEEKLGLGVYEVIGKLEECAYDKLDELRSEAKNK